MWMVGASTESPAPTTINTQQSTPKLGLSVTAAAKALGVSRKSLSQLLNGKSGISPEMALQLSLAFGPAPSRG